MAYTSYTKLKQLVSSVSKDLEHSPNGLIHVSNMVTINRYMHLVAILISVAIGKCVPTHLYIQKKKRTESTSACFTPIK